jgi:hypothetical protein
MKKNHLKFKWDRVIILTFAVIGVLFVGANLISIGKKVCYTVTHHSWSMVVIK